MRLSVPVNFEFEGSKELGDILITGENIKTSPMIMVGHLNVAMSFGLDCDPLANFPQTNFGLRGNPSIPGQVQCKLVALHYANEARDSR